MSATCMHGSLHNAFGPPYESHCAQIALTGVYHILSLARPPQLRSTIERSTCYRHFVVGWANLNYMLSTRTKAHPPPVPKMELLRFRDYAWTRAYSGSIEA
jgi:hypothetical protein